MPLETFVNEYLATLSPGYFVRQYITVICLFAFGMVLSDCLSDRGASPLKRCALAYPLGLCAFSVTAYVMIVIGIPYNKWTVCTAIALETAAAVFLNRKSHATYCFGVKRRLLLAVAVLVIAFIAVCGAAPVIISNDTMYYYRRYPDCIVYYGGLRDQFDYWLTDTGLGAVAADTLPALFGFRESFGIREFFHINFIVYFGICIYEKAKEHIPGKGSAVAALLITALLATATPFVILGHWGLANMYFMELFFIAAYYTYDCGANGFGASALLITALALFRIEGTMFVVWLILCLSLYSGLGKKLAGYVLVPVFILFGGYCLKIFTEFYVLDNIYTFLTPQKAAALVGMIGFAAVYLLCIEPHLPKRLHDNLPWLYIAAEILGNIVFLALDHERYIGNLKVFCANLFRQSGWGVFSYFAVMMALLFAVEYMILYKSRKMAPDRSDAFNILLTAGFMLIVLAASFGRGDLLAEDVGDSGNRVLLQIVPLIVMTFGELGIKLAGAWKE